MGGGIEMRAPLSQKCIGDIGMGGSRTQGPLLRTLLKAPYCNRNPKRLSAVSHNLLPNPKRKTMNSRRT